MGSSRRWSWFTLWLYFLLGFASTLAQAFLLREFLFLCYGSELYLGLVFAAWLFWIGVGAEVGSRVAPRLSQPRTVFGVALIAASPVLGCQIAALRSARAWLHIAAGLNLGVGHVILVTLIALLPAAFFPGFVFPLALRAGSSEEDPKEVAKLYIAESAGSLFAGVLFSFLLVALLGAMVSASLAFVLLASSGLLVLLAGGKPFAPQSAKRSAASVLIAALLALDLGVVVISVRLEKQTILRRWHSLKTGSQLIWSRDSKYQNACLSTSGDQFNVFTDGHYAFSFPDPYQSAVNAAILLSQHPKPQSMLVVGDGLEDLIVQLLCTPVRQVDWVQRDPAMARWVHNHLPKATRAALRTERLHIVFTDGRRFVHQITRRYDLIYVNAADPSTALANRYYTREFFERCAAVLRPGGVFSTRMMLTEGYVGEEMGAVGGTIYRTLKDVFPHIMLCPGDNTFLFASRQANVVSDEADVLRKRLAHWVGSHRQTDILPEVLYSFYLPGHVAAVLQRLEAWSLVPLNTDLRPTAYFKYVRLWDRMTGEHLRKTSRRLHSYRLIGGVLLAVVAALSGWSVLRRRRRGPSDAVPLFCALVAGLAAMALELVVLLYYQTKFGYLYQMIGLLVAAFMVGLALGGFVARRIVGNLRLCLFAASAVLLATAAFSVALPWILEGLWRVSATVGGVSEFCFPVLLLLAGGLTGAGLPLLVVLSGHSVGNLARATGRVSRADHLGGALGALFGGAYLLPVLGLVATCQVVAGLTFFSGVLLFTAGMVYNDSGSEDPASGGLPSGLEG